MALCPPLQSSLPPTPHIGLLYSSPRKRHTTKHRRITHQPQLLHWPLCNLLVPSICCRTSPSVPTVSRLPLLYSQHTLYQQRACHRGIETIKREIAYDVETSQSHGKQAHRAGGQVHRAFVQSVSLALGLQHVGAGAATGDSEVRVHEQNDVVAPVDRGSEGGGGRGYVK